MADYKVKLTMTVVVRADSMKEACDRAIHAAVAPEDDIPMYVQGTYIRRKNQWPQEWGDREPLEAEPRTPSMGSCDLSDCNEMATIERRMRTRIPRGDHEDQEVEVFGQFCTDHDPGRAAERYSMSGRTR